MDLKFINEELDEQKTKELLISLGAVGAGYLLKKVLEAGYEKLYDEDPPNQIDDREPNWGKLAGWTIVSGIAATALRVLIRRYGGSTIK